MKLLISLSFALLIFSGFAMATPTSSFANGNNNNQGNNNHNDNSDCRKHPEKRECGHNDDNDCRKHPEKRECHVSVPEFGAITGVIALVSSGGTFLFLKKRYN